MYFHWYCSGIVDSRVAILKKHSYYCMPVENVDPQGFGESECVVVFVFFLNHAKLRKITKTIKQTALPPGAKFVGH